MAVTRIQNNQITQQTIDYTRLVPGTLVGSVFNANLTLNSNVTIVGNLAVSGNTTTINSTNTYVNDPLITFNNGYIGAATYDIGMVVNRNLASMPGYGSMNAFLGWKESEQAFVSIATTETGNTAGAVNNSGYANIHVGNITANSLTLSTGTLTAVNGILNTPISGSTGYFTTAFATNFSTGNAQITGGTSFVGTSGTPIASIYAGTAGLTTLSSTNTTAINFYSGNVFLNGGYANNLANIAAGTAYLATLNSSTGNITALSGTSANIITVYASNFSSPNIRVSGGYLTGLANVGTVYETATNFYSGNAVITGGYQTGLANSSATYGTFTNLNSSNVLLTGGSVLGLTQFTATTAQATNFSSGNAQITGGNVLGLTTLQTGSANFNNVSTGNIWITGGYADNFPIGANVASTGAFTNLTASGTVTFTNTTNAVGSTGSGALQVAGGVGIAKDLWVGGNVYASALNSTSFNQLLVNSPLLYLEAQQTAYPYNYNIGFYSHFVGGPANVYAHTAFVRNYSDNAWWLVSNIPEPSGNTVNLSTTALVYDAFKAGNIVAANTTPSTSSTTGALVVLGGAGIAGSIYSGPLNATYGNIQNSLYAGSVNTANAVISGGYISAMSNIASTYGTFTNLATGNAVITGGSITGITIPALGTVNITNFSSGNAQITGGSINATVIGNSTPAAATFTQLNTTGISYLGGNVVANSTTASTSTSTGAIVIAGTGGMGIGGALNVGGISNFSSNVLFTAATATNNNTTGALVVTQGGLAVSGNINSAGQMFIGSLAQATPLTSAIAVKRGTSSSGAGVQYTQDALINGTNTGSSDFIAYPNNYNLAVGDQGWADMGFTGDAFNDVNYTLTKANDGYFFVSGANTTVGGNLVMATGGTGSYNDIVIGVGGFVSSAEVARFHGNVANNGNFTIKLPTNSAPTANVGAFQVWGGTSLSGNVYHGGATLLNGSGATGNDTIIKGKNDATLLWARPGTTYDQVVIGNSATTSTLVTGAKLLINSTDSILLPSGTTAQQPGNAGGTNVAGMFRYNSQTGFVEWYNGSGWQTASTNVITIATDQQFAGTGSQTVYTLSQSTTTAGVIVSINGVVQIPTLAYSVTGGTTLTFTEAPASTDVIDVRILTTTQTVTVISSTNGYFQFSTDNNGAYVSTGTSTPTVTTSWVGNGAEVWSVGNVSVASSGSATQIDSFATATYRSAQYTVQVTNGTSNYQVFDALLIHNGSTANLVVINSATVGSSTGALTATVSGGNAILNFTAANAGNQVRVRKVYQII